MPGVDKDKRGRIILERIPYAGMREFIGQRMRASLDIAPQGSMMAQADMKNVISFRETLKSRGYRVSFVDIFTKIVACAIEKVPIINATLDEEKRSIIVYKTINAGIAVRVEHGVVVPVINDIQDKDVLKIAAESKDYIAKARDNRFSEIPLDGATINNLGIFKIDGCTPFLNLPEATMLCLGSIRETPWVDEHGQIVVRPVITLTGTNDHRVNDGADLAEFLDYVQEIMRQPEAYCL